MLRLLLLSFLCVVSTCVPAQLALRAAYPEVREADGQVLPLAWLGGLNAPQYNQADLDGDGLDELVLFDRAGDALLALRGDGQGNYQPAPELTAGFPTDLTDWILLRDYDADGIQDLFAYSFDFEGFRVYRGRRAADGLLTYPAEPTYRGLRYPLGNGTTAAIFVTNLDYPNVDDVDGDGDLDILTFSVGGGYLEYYQNQSVERGFGTDTLIYTLADDCWGGFFESGQGPALSLASGPGACFRSVRGEEVERRHAGSTTLTLDVTGNGLKDVLLGDISYESITLGRNTGSREEAYISSQHPSWPAESTPVEVNIFPGIYAVDVDQDGVDDLVASPSQTLNTENVDVGWYYRNAGTQAVPNFVFQDSQQFVRQSIDYGNQSLPAAFDYDGDGRPDLVVGNNDEYTDGRNLNSQLRLLRNVGTPGGPAAFVFVQEDYLGLSQFQNETSALAPAFGDLDGDGDEDAVVGERGGRLIYLENTAGPGRTATFAAPVFGYMDIDVGQLSKPALADLDRDGLTDLLIGEFRGRIQYYRNVGTPGAPRFDSDVTAAGNQAQLGGINTNTPGSSTGHPAPVVLTYPDRFVLLTGNRAGFLEAYEFTEPTTAFTPLSRQVDGLDLGAFTVPAAADFNQDGQIELVLGNQRGGLTYLSSNLAAEAPTSLFRTSQPTLQFTAFPNPTTGQLVLSGWAGPQVERITVMNELGQSVQQFGPTRHSRVTVDLSALPAGVYVVTVVTGAGVGSRKVVKGGKGE